MIQGPLIYAVGNTFASATLTANNKTNTATEHYYLYLNIKNNTFTYSVQDKDNNLELTISNEKETRKNEQKFINGIRDKNPTNAIELLKVADDSGLLKDNHSFVATSENETIRMENDELVEYIIPEDVYEKTKNEITYEMPRTDSYEKHPEAFQLTKKVTK